MYLPIILTKKNIKIKMDASPQDMTFVYSFTMAKTLWNLKPFCGRPFRRKMIFFLHRHNKKPCLFSLILHYFHRVFYRAYIFCEFLPVFVHLLKEVLDSEMFAITIICDSFIVRYYLFTARCFTLITEKIK